jgi:hypothetical protein
MNENKNLFVKKRYEEQVSSLISQISSLKRLAI